MKTKKVAVGLTPEQIADARRERDRLLKQKQRAAYKARVLAYADGSGSAAGQQEPNGKSGPVPDPSPEEIRAAVNELRREKGLPEV